MKASVWLKLWQAPKKPSFWLGFLLFAIVVLLCVFVIWEKTGYLLWRQTAAFDLKKEQWVVLLGVFAAACGWIISAMVTIRNSIKQHTINILLQSRISATYMENAKLVNSRYFGRGGMYRLSKSEYLGKAEAAQLPALNYVLNYLEFVAAGIRQGDLDERLMKQTLRGIVCGVFRAASPIIISSRAKRVLPDKTTVKPKAFENLIWLYRRWDVVVLRQKTIKRPSEPQEKEGLCAVNLYSMKDADFYFWMIPQQPPKKPYRSKWRMTLEDGRARYPGGHPDLASKETRQVPSTEEERIFRGHSNQSYAPKIPMLPGETPDLKV